MGLARVSALPLCSLATGLRDERVLLRQLLLDLLDAPHCRVDGQHELRARRERTPQEDGTARLGCAGAIEWMRGKVAEREDDVDVQK